MLCCSTLKRREREREREKKREREREKQRERERERDSTLRLGGKTTMSLFIVIQILG